MAQMRAAVRELFKELADLPPPERNRIYSDRGISAELYGEVESLLSHDSASAENLARRVSDVAEDALRSDGSPLVRDCGPYRLVQLLGSGGMGSVYLGERRDGEIEHKVAIKLLRYDADRPAWRDRFLRERQLLAYLNHPAIARLLDAGHTDDGLPYLVMEHVDGVAIDEYVGPLDLEARLSLFLQVCDGVSHAHRHLIIHRDLKPSNILVDLSGHPKLLDFGIAKLIDVTSDDTQTVERLLTPNYASPEQFRGGVQTTATDIYSLGAVLHKLLTGRSPHEPVTEGAAKLPRDVDHVLRKALREEPEERYASVDAFADDLRTFLAGGPVVARSGDAWYRTRKFLRRFWVPALAAVVTVAGLSIGLYVANRERDRAERRFQQVRQLSNRILGLDAVIGALPGSTKARHEIVSMSKEYLESLVPDPRDDQELALEIGVAYAVLARAEGVPGFQNLGLYPQAEESLRKAEALVEPILKASPRNRRALYTLAGVSQGLMLLARQAGRNEEAQVHATKAVEHLDMFLALGELSQVENGDVARMLYTIAGAYRNMHLHEEAIRYVRRSIELARSLPRENGVLADGLSRLADLTRISGDLDGALQAIREASTIVEATVYANEGRRRNAWFQVLWIEGVILGGGNGLSLSRPAEAIAVLQRAFDQLEEGARSDPNDASIRILFDQTSRELGTLLRDRDPLRALEMYDDAIRRLEEVENSARALQGKAGALAGSSYALRRLNRAGEAKNRIDAAFQLLRETKDYPTDRIDTDSEVEPTYRALADHYADTGQPQRAAEVYQELLDKVVAANPDSGNDLRRATKLSRIYDVLAGLYHRIHNIERSDAVAAMRRNLWREWNRKLPNNAYVRRQLQAAGG